MRVWYDQSGNGHHFNQSNILLMPSIVTSGVVQKFGNNPVVSFNQQSQSCALVTSSQLVVAYVSVVVTSPNSDKAAILSDTQSQNGWYPGNGYDGSQYRVFSSGACIADVCNGTSYGKYLGQIYSPAYNTPNPAGLLNAISITTSINSSNTQINAIGPIAPVYWNQQGSVNMGFNEVILYSYSPPALDKLTIERYQLNILTMSVSSSSSSSSSSSPSPSSSSTGSSSTSSSSSSNS